VAVIGDNERIAALQALAEPESVAAPVDRIGDRTGR
jgi:hypothetical protein